ncbi:MAG: F-box protein [Chlamydiales bacterium]
MSAPRIHQLPPQLVRKIHGFLDVSEVFSSQEVCKRWRSGLDDLVSLLVRDRILPSFVFPSNGNRREALKTAQSEIYNRVTLWAPAEAIKPSLESSRCCFTLFKNQLFIGIGPKIEVRKTSTNEIEYSLKPIENISHFTLMKVLDDQRIAVACEQLELRKKTLLILSLPAGKVISRFDYDVRTMVTYRGSLYFGTAAGNVYCQATRDGEATLFSFWGDTRNPVCALATNERFLVISRRKGRPNVHDRISKEKKFSLPAYNPTDQIFHWKRDLFIWGNAKRETFVYDAATQKILARLVPVAKKDALAKVNNLASRHLFSCFGNLLVSISADALRIFDLVRKTHLHTFKTGGRKELGFADGKLFVLVQNSGQKSEMLMVDFWPRRNPKMEGKI